MLTVVCVKAPPSDYYSDEWVRKLERGVKRHLKAPHRFVCLTCDQIDGIETIPLVHRWGYHWAKLECFRPGLFDGPVIYMDLDVLFTGDISFLADARPSQDSFLMIDDIPSLPEIHNSTLMGWDARNAKWAGMFEEFARNEDHYKAKYRWSPEAKAMYGDQAFIADYIRFFGHEPVRWQQVYPKEWFQIFSSLGKVEPEAIDWQPEDEARFWYCLGEPKFHQRRDMPLVAKNWI